MPERKPPNVVLIVLDSVRAPNCSAYGYGRETTPQLARLAAEGTLYEQAISVGCWTLPVHASIFTGRYPVNHGLTESRHALRPGTETLATKLRAAGYRTGCFSNNAYISDATGLVQGFDHVDDIWRITNPRGIALPKLSKRIKELERGGPLRRVAAELLRHARHLRAVIRAWRSRKDSGASLTNERLMEWIGGEEPTQPFFVFANYMETHEPYLPPYPYNRRFISSRYSPFRVARASARRDEVLTAEGGPRREDLEILESLYDGTLRYADEMVGRLADALRSRGLLDDTVLIITSDHGDSFGEHGHLGHRLTLYDELLHVPLVIRHPESFRAGTRVREQVQLGDIYPLVLELAGIGADGDFVSLLAPAPDRTALAENTGPKSINGLESKAVRRPPHKFIWRSDDQHELYDLASDPGERSNLVESEPEVARRLHKDLERMLREMRDDEVRTSEALYDEETLERLRALGYVG
ncbi:MAG: sulfatase-like hydrolase/transferase [Chloroflexota bacterium]|nr:sulfatase-like hydrolase/transferase [Chloroflexota bacterium]